MQNLVIVESPTKSKTLQRFLGEKYKVEATMGHIRDLPKSDFGVDIKNNFEPLYVIPRDKRKRVNELKKMAESSKTLYLATDPDREGEAIAWHIAELLTVDDGKSKVVVEDRSSKIEKQEIHPQPSILKKLSSTIHNLPSIHRVVFHEITEEAIKEAFEHPREIDLKLVDAQQARRVLDRLVGYKLSPLLWQKVKKGSSAGRVQSVALRLIIEREREVKAFKAEEYWIIEAELSKHLRGELTAASDAHPGGEEKAFLATLIEQNGKKIAIKNKAQADGHVKNLEKAQYIISKVTQKEVRRYPYPPFITSTLQQASANKLGMSAKKTMMIAQALYEHGLITYTRTDSVNLSVAATLAVRAYIENFIGKSHLPAAPRIFKSKSKNAQEAHEAIRVTDIRRQSVSLRQVGGMNKDHVRLYDLIWKRFVACQMSEAVLEQTGVDVIASEAKQSNSAGDPSLIAQDESRSYLLRATGSVIRFEGWLKLYGKDIEDKDEKNQILPKLAENQQLDLVQLLPAQHFTEPPPRYNEASLIKKLEELGIGRPSTYAPILSTIQDRFYVERIEKKFIPTQLGFAVNDFIVQYFPNIVDYSFTAQMEDELDEIARGERQWQPTLREFYEPFEKKLEEVEKVAQRVKMEVELAGKKCPECGKDLIIRIGKFGKFLACSGFPECKHTESIEEKVNAKCLQDGGGIVVRKTRKGKTFYGCKNWPVCKFASWTKPKPNAPVIASEATPKAGEAKQSTQ